MSSAPVYEVDVVVVGAGHNGLVAAAYLARAGLEVAVLEREEAPGGAMRTEALTVPGYLHDTFSSWHPQFVSSPVWRELGKDLRRHGARFATPLRPTGTVRPDGTLVVADPDPAVSAQSFGSADAARYCQTMAAMDRVSPALGRVLESAPRSRAGAVAVARLLATGMTPSGRRILRHGPASVRGALADFDGSDARDLLAPWGLHGGWAPDDPGGGIPVLAIGHALHRSGMPVSVGGSGTLVRAYVQMIQEAGGTVSLGQDVDQILVEGGRAIGTRAASQTVLARRAVVADVTPSQLEGRLLDRPGRDRTRYARRVAGQFHLALSRPPRWHDERLQDVALFHVTSGVDGVALACRQAEAGMLPAQPTLAVGQPVVADPSRAPAGGSVLWVQLLELPRDPVFDALDGTVLPGSWTPDVAARLEGRVLDLLRPLADRLDEDIVGAALLTPADLARRNINLIGGDPYSGVVDLGAVLGGRPGHRTDVAGLVLCGASTHPGPGLHGLPGRIAAGLVLADKPNIDI